MVAYSFKPQFVNPILAGTKEGTIRAPGLRRHAMPGEQLQLYTGMRTKRCRLIVRTVCLQQRRIQLNFRRGRVATDGEIVSGAAALDVFARWDGFADFAAMRQFWGDTHGTDRFEGVWIRWLRPTSPVAMGATITAGGSR